MIESCTIILYESIRYALIWASIYSFIPRNLYNLYFLPFIFPFSLYIFSAGLKCLHYRGPFITKKKKNSVTHHFPVSHLLLFPSPTVYMYTFFILTFQNSLQFSFLSNYFIKVTLVLSSRNS